MNVQSYILQQAVDARHAEFVRQAESARRAASASRRRRIRIPSVTRWFGRSLAAHPENVPRPSLNA
jgi:hypothetical protein